MKYSLALSWLPFSLALHIPRTDKPINECSAQSIIDLLKMEPSDEKGFFTQTFIDPETVHGTNRSVSTAIYYLLKGSEGDSLWHKLDAAEVWHYYAGAPLVLSVSWNNGSCGEEHVMGSNLFAGERPQAVVRADEWQRARSLGDWTLVGTTVAPAFVPSGQAFEAEGWEPKGCKSG
ncbi:uncharacterized protein FIESC28_05906 [Fusarium coffeatum]|uniref:DUF985 domain-containing protein n=1 Tax=Fusarium coffeatum TaxID=231269 RepID=A0A366RR42_9HYPO|nr:uncharacterized protein FIESC28_05906 [Fusarium coffeatum]RBR18765.1 hypothetical protein FIESC28_05906 [Fusarium coffeatum]